MAVNRSIRQQVSIITAGVAGGVVGIVLLLTLYMSFQSTLDDTADQGVTLARVLGDNVTASIAFRDPATATEILEALRNSDQVVFAEVVLADGSRFAEYQKRSNDKGLSKADGDLGTNADRYLKTVSQAIVLGDTELGSVRLQIDIWPAYATALTGLWVGLIIWLLGTLAAYFLASRLNQTVVRPLQQLSRLMVGVSREEDYTKRFNYRGDDEVGALGVSFNTMLSQIEDREARLQEVIRELESARDQAEEAARSKSSFLANMSHEIRTPMNGVVGMTSLLKRTELTKQQQLYFDTIEKSASSLLMIIDDILDFTKIEAGRLEIKQQTFSLRETIEAVSVFFSEPAAQKGLDFTIDMAANLPDRVIGDSGRIRQVLLNLVGNAIKFTQQGSVTLSIATQMEETGNRIRFTVTDTGIGIHKEKQDRIFSEFFQADATSTRQFGGTGLGLAISRQLVVLMGGSIGFSSEQQKGSVFWFEVPLKTEVLNPFLTSRLQASTSSQSEKPQRLDEEIATSTDEAPRWEAKVLVAEDSEVNQFIIRELLGTFGLEPVIVANGAECVAAFRDNPYDIIFMDIQMPVMDGVAATKAIRALQREEGMNTDCLIIGLSAHAMIGDKERYMEEGMDDYLTKPVDLKELEALIKRHLRPVRGMMLWR